MICILKGILKILIVMVKPKTYLRLLVASLVLTAVLVVFFIALILWAIFCIGLVPFYPILLLIALAKLGGCEKETFIDRGGYWFYVKVIRRIGGWFDWSLDRLFNIMDYVVD